MIEFIIPSTEDRIHLLENILSCLKVQDCKEWKAHIIFDGKTALTEADWSKYGDVKASSIDGPNNDWGHTAREYGKNNSTEEWVVMTGDDNYYVPVFVKEFTKWTSNPNCNFIHCNMIYNNWDYQPLKCRPIQGEIDMGVFAVRSELAKQIPIGKWYGADGDFALEYLKKFGYNCIKIDKYLYVHN